MKPVCLAVLALAVFAGIAQASPPPTISGPAIAPDANGRAPVSASYTQRAFSAFIGANVGPTQNAPNNAGGYGETDRVNFTTIGPVTQLQLKLTSKYLNTGIEYAAANPVFYRAALECPAGGTSTPPLFELPGQSLPNGYMEVFPNSNGQYTAPLSVYIPAATTCFIRLWTGVVYPPSSPAAALVAGGSLTTSTTYYYKVTCKRFGVESGPNGTEVSATPTSGNQSISISVATPTHPLGCDYFNIYRATSSGQERYLASQALPQTTFIDTGSLSTISAATAPALNVYYFNSYQLPQNSYDSSTGSANDLTVGSGTTGFTTTGASVTQVSVPEVILGDDLAGIHVLGVGDSIMQGLGIQTASAALGTGPNMSNWFYQSLSGFDFLNDGSAGSRAAQFCNQAYFAVSQRMLDIQGGSYVYSNLGANDLNAGSYTWQQLASCQILIGQKLQANGQRFYVGTLLPFGTTTDNMLAAAHYTAATSESQRQGENTWIRLGMQVNAGVPCNTASCGTPTPYINGYFDAAATVETNAAGTFTLNGGYWKPATLLYSSQVLTATPTTSGGDVTLLTVGAASYTPHALAGDVAMFGSLGTTGNSCVIGDNTATTITCNTTSGGGENGLIPMTTVPSNGASFSIYQTFSQTGIHPTLAGHNLIAQSSNGFAAFATATFEKF